MSNEPRARLEIRLTGGQDGAIPLAHLAAMSDLQQAVLRLAKNLSGRAGRRGRSPRPLEGLTDLNAVEILPGSAVLVVEAPTRAAELSLEGVDEDVGLQALTQLEDVLESLSNDLDPPMVVDAHSLQSIESFLRGLEDYDSVQLHDWRGERHRRVTFTPRAVLPRLHLPQPATAATPSVITGLLYAVDIKHHRYGVEDDLGRSIHLHFPADGDHLDEIRHLVGDRVVARGSVDTAGTDGAVRLRIDALEPAAPVEQSNYFTFDLDAALRSAMPIVSLADLRIPDLDEEEARRFWEAVTE